MVFVRLTDTSDVPLGAMKAFELKGQKILLANSNGSFYALANKCPHIGKPLDKGTLVGCNVTCPYHHAQFDVRNGQNLKDAKLLFLKMACKSATTFPVKVEGEDVLIEVS